MGPPSGIGPFFYPHYVCRATLDLPSPRTLELIRCADLLDVNKNQGFALMRERCCRCCNVYLALLSIIKNDEMFLFFFAKGNEPFLLTACLYLFSFHLGGREGLDAFLKRGEESSYYDDSKSFWHNLNKQDSIIAFWYQ